MIFSAAAKVQEIGWKRKEGGAVSKSKFLVKYKGGTLKELSINEYSIINNQFIQVLKVILQAFESWDVCRFPHA